MHIPMCLESKSDKHYLYQLDLGTRLCIKDCLYRLAESADQRQKHVNLNGDCGDEQDSNDAPSGERNEYVTFS